MAVNLTAAKAALAQLMTRDGPALVWDEYGRKGGEVSYAHLVTHKGPKYAGPPLRDGGDHATVGHNIKMMLAQGVPHREAIAAALGHAEQTSVAAPGGGNLDDAIQRIMAKGRPRPG